MKIDCPVIPIVVGIQQIRVMVEDSHGNTGCIRLDRKRHEKMGQKSIVPGDSLTGLAESIPNYVVVEYEKKSISTISDALWVTVTDVLYL
jgi:hypothetical protein